MAKPNPTKAVRSTLIKVLTDMACDNLNSGANGRGDILRVWYVGTKDIGIRMGDGSEFLLKIVPGGK